MNNNILNVLCTASCAFVSTTTGGLTSLFWGLAAFVWFLVFVSELKA